MWHSRVAIAGALVGAVSSVVGSGFSLLSLPFALWSALPYLVLWRIGRAAVNPWPWLGAGTAALAADIGIRASVFIWPRGSTAAIALVFSPAYIAVIIMPAGAAAGWVMGRLWRWNIIGRSAVAALSPAILGLLVLGFARPDLFPSTVAKRRAALERIGPPRVVTGNDRFKSAIVDARPAWHLAANLDDAPGEEIAIVDHSGAVLVDPVSLQQLRRITFGGTPGRLWTSFSTLFRSTDGTVAVADTGGGFSRTLVKSLEGAVLWEYRPDPDLPPTTLRPADLDRDGVVEFYTAAKGFVMRLDISGREVWRRPATLASLVAVLPSDPATPSWIVGLEYGRRVIVWDAAGATLGERAVAADDSPLAAADSPFGRLLIQGGRLARGLDLGGVERFQVDLGDFTLSQAVGLRTGNPARVLLALAATTDRDTKRTRVMLIDGDQQIVYDEILDVLPRLLTADLGNGSQELFLAGPGGLRRLQMRRAVRP
jgi:hypothetical protein